MLTSHGRTKQVPFLGSGSFSVSHFPGADASGKGKIRGEEKESLFSLLKKGRLRRGSGSSVFRRNGENAHSRTNSGLSPGKTFS